MAKKSKETNPFTGRWRIVSMSAWDQGFIDEEEEGFFEFNDRGWGQGQLQLKGCSRKHFQQELVAPATGATPHHDAVLAWMLL